MSEPGSGGGEVVDGGAGADDLAYADVLDADDECFAVEGGLLVAEATMWPRKGRNNATSTEASRFCDA